MARREIFAGNWKMYKCYKEAVELVEGLLNQLEDIGSREVAIFPPAIYVKDIANLCNGTQIDVGIQNIYYEKEGAFTGEISPMMAKDIGLRYALIGHSERRHIFGETDECVNRKLRAAIEFDLEPVVCVGESLDEREKGQSEEIVKRQVKEAFKGVEASMLGKVIIAYEPVWAIGSGRVATPEVAEFMHKLIRDTMKDEFDEKIADNQAILYGGSVKPDNIAGLFSMENIDGVLVGGASLKIKSFLDIIHLNNI